MAAEKGTLLKAYFNLYQLLGKLSFSKNCINKTLRYKQMIDWVDNEMIIITKIQYNFKLSFISCGM